MSVLLDGSVANEYVQADAHVASIQSLDTGSIYIRFKIVDNSLTQRITTWSDKSEASRDLFYLYVTGSGAFQFFVRNGVTTDILFTLTSTSLGDGNFHELVFTVDSGGNTMYVDGVEDTTRSYSNGTSATQAFFDTVPTIDTWRYGIGEDSGGLETPMDGAHSDVAIWSSKLTAAEALALTQSKVKYFPLQVQPSTLVVYHPLDDVANGVSANTKTFIDMSGNGNDATGVQGLGEAVELLSYQPHVIIPGVSDAVAGNTITAETQTYSVTGIDVNLVRTLRLTAETATYSATGIDVGLNRSLSLAAEPQTYTVTGIDVGLRTDRQLVADTQTYAVTGVDVGLKRALRLSLDTATYAVTGIDTTLTKTAANTLTANTANYSVTGIDVTLTVTGAAEIDADTQNYAVTGIDANLIRALRLVAETQTYGVTGVDVGITKGSMLALATQTYGVTGIDVATRRTKILVGDVQTYSVESINTTLTFSGAAAVAQEFRDIILADKFHNIRL